MVLLCLVCDFVLRVPEFSCVLHATETFKTFFLGSMPNVNYFMTLVMMTMKAILWYMTLRVHIKIPLLFLTYTCK